MTGGGGGRPAPHPAPTLALVTQINIFPGLRGADGTRVRGIALGSLQGSGMSGVSGPWGSGARVSSGVQAGARTGIRTELKSGGQLVKRDCRVRGPLPAPLRPPVTLAVPSTRAPLACSVLRIRTSRAAL